MAWTVLPGRMGVEDKSSPKLTWCEWWRLVVAPVQARQRAPLQCLPGPRIVSFPFHRYLGEGLLSLRAVALDVLCH